MTALVESPEAAAPEQFVPVGLRDSAVPAWRALVRVLLELDKLGIRTPCDEDPAAFLGDDLDLRQQAAKRCGLCPIRSECGTFASMNGEKHGVWAGRDRTRGAVTKRRLRERAERLRQAEVDTFDSGEDEHAFTTNTGESTTYRSGESERPEDVCAGQRHEEHDVQHRSEGPR